MNISVRMDFLFLHWSSWVSALTHPSCLGPGLGNQDARLRVRDFSLLVLIPSLGSNLICPTRLTSKPASCLPILRDLVGTVLGSSLVEDQDPNPLNEHTLRSVSLELVELQ